MTESCNHDCGNCSQECSERPKTDFLEKTHSLSHIKKVIGVVSGKGGVGKSLVTSLLAVMARRKGYNTAILDADITGPSIPKMFGIKQKAMGDELGLYPVKSDSGIRVMSLNLLLDNETAPVVWRGPIIAATVKQFWTDVIWGDVDFMFVDMPPGTGDVSLTVFQSIAVDGIVVVTSPQELVSMIVAKALNMANMMNVPIIGIVENMSYIQCPDCNKKIKVFGESHLEQTAASGDLTILGQIPIEPKLAKACDDGKIESFEGDWLDSGANKIFEDMTK